MKLKLEQLLREKGGQGDTANINVLEMPQCFFDIVDHNGDGRISFDEWKWVRFFTAWLPTGAFRHAL